MIIDNTYSKLPPHFFSKAKAAKFSAPQIFAFNNELADSLEINLNSKSKVELSEIFSGQKLFFSDEPIALTYAAHQFGHFVDQLGDGRAMLLAEVVANNGKRYDLQLKGSGPTAYSRNGDGMSELGPVVREYILSEAMHHLGVPTTRALAAVTTGDNVYRESVLPGGVFTRVASSHIRIGTFQFFASRSDTEGLKTLLDYCITRHYPEINQLNESERALSFLKSVMNSQITLVSKWMSLGFIHGVMNTDNMSISGETLDYGPCAFMDNYNSNRVFSFIDQNGRYAYSNQGEILQWNLSRLAECLIPFIDIDQNLAVAKCNDLLSSFSGLFAAKVDELMFRKLGLDSGTETLKMWLDLLEEEDLDFTLSFRNLTQELEGSSINLYFNQTTLFKNFVNTWKKQLQIQGKDFAQVKESMNSINPLYIPRNHQVEHAIQAARKNDFTIFNEMNELLKNPYTAQPSFEKYELAPLKEQRIKNTFCGT